MGSSKASDHGSAAKFSMTGFVSESTEELKKVSTPTRAETIQSTLVTIVIMVFVSVCLLLLDLFFNYLMSNLLG